VKQNNPDGQRMLASTLIPQPESMMNAPPEEDVNMSFGRLFSSFAVLEKSVLSQLVY